MSAVVWTNEAREAVRAVYEDADCLCGNDGCPEATGAILDALAPHVAAMLDQARAEAWDEGRDAGHQEARSINPEWPDPPTNPYRADRAVVDEEDQ